MPYPRSLKAQQRWSDRHLFPWAIASLVLTVIQHVSSLDLVSTGSAHRMGVTYIPVVFGTFVLAALRWRYIKLRIKDMNVSFP
ncbi:MAG: hypothetical protein JNM62_09000 [Flavobacteriales bacterium]|nr:hypothetical protein [Flavobacteriales bacterium]